MTLGVSGLAGLITFAVAAIVLAGLLRPPLISTSIGAGRVIAGPLGPRLQACELLYRWEATGKTSLLNRAVAEAWSPRVPLLWKVRIRTDFSGLRSWIRVEKKLAHSPDAVPYSPSDLAHNYEHAIRGVCNKFGAGLNSRDRSEFRRDAAKAQRAAGP